MEENHDEAAFPCFELFVLVFKGLVPVLSTKADFGLILKPGRVVGKSSL